MINYGIIGCGMMGHEHLRNIALLEGTNVSVIFEPNPEMAKSAATHEPDARLVSSLDELFWIARKAPCEMRLTCSGIMMLNMK